MKIFLVASGIFFALVLSALLTIAVVNTFLDNDTKD